MGVLYTITSVSNYNSNPPSDDGAQTAANRVQWSSQKTKLVDPVYNAFNSSETATSAAFGKTLDGAAVTTTAISYPMSATDQGSLIKATASGITITTPDAGTVGAPFTFAINNQSTGTITLAGNATNSQTVDGQTTQVINAGAGCIVKTDGTNWFTFGLKSAQITSGANPPYGFDVPINLQINATTASNILTVAVKANNGSDPTPSNPVLIPFRDAASTSVGDPVWVSVTSALSITTNAVGATLGTQNGVPFRFWILAFNNAGTVVLALWHSGAGASVPVINPLAEWNFPSTTGMSAAATSAGVFYTPNGTSLVNCAFRIIGFLEYSPGLTTAGTYASNPNRVQLFGPGIHKPGTTVQTQFNSSTSGLAITPTSSINLIKASLSGYVQTAAASPSSVNISFKRANPGAITLGTQLAQANATSAFQTPFSAIFLDAPQSTNSATYSVTATGTSAAVQNEYNLLEEIMG